MNSSPLFSFSFSFDIFCPFFLLFSLFNDKHLFVMRKWWKEKKNRK